MASNSVSILLVGTGRLDPQLEVLKRVVTAYVKQARKGLPNGVWNVWGDICEGLTKYKEPISSYIRAINWLGWKPVGPCRVEHDLGVLDATSYGDIVGDSVRAARNRLWADAIQNRPK